MSSEPNSTVPIPDADAPPPIPQGGPIVAVTRPSAAAIAVPIVIFFAVVFVLVGGYFALNRWSRRREATEERARRVKAAKKREMEHGRRQRAREAEEERQMKGLDDMEMEELETPGRSKRPGDIEV